MKKSNFSTIIDLGHSNFKYGIFDNNFINIYFSSKDIREANSEEDYSKNNKFPNTRLRKKNF